MVVFIGIICSELIALYILSRRLSQNLFIAIFLLTKSRPVAVGFLSFIFFPGTVIHELAHLFTAEILGVRTSGLTLVPEGIEQKNVRTGSVSIAQSDPLRRAVIGVAPIFVGLGVLGMLSYFLPDVWQHVRLDAETGMLFHGTALYLFLLLGYAFFAVSNTMFSSPEDMEGFWPVVGVMTLVAVALFLVGIRIDITQAVYTGLTQFSQTMGVILGYVALLNGGLYMLSLVIIRVVQRLTNRRLA